MKKLKDLRYWLPIITAVTFVLGILLGEWLNRKEHLTPGQEKLNELFTLITDNYVDSVSLDSVIEMSLPAILSSLDPHSSYIPASELEEVNSELDGSFGGIGIQFQIFNDTVSVVEVIAGGPSEKAGLMAGDRIIAVDGKAFNPKEIGGDEEVRNKLRGEKGSQVKLTILRHPNNKPMEFTVTRGDIPMTSVESYYMADETTGYVKVSRFARTTYKEFLLALSELSVNGAEDFIIDLRGNTGGYMEPAIQMVNEFLPRQKVIVSTRGRNKPEEICLSDGRGLFSKARVVLLIDEMSASSSEIFAGAIQDNDRGLIIGRRSFGKGLVQQPIDMGDGSQIRLTIQRYYTPSGRSIQKTYTPGENEKYEYEIFERYRNGEIMNADSIKINKDLMFKTVNGRTVYGGGGIMPDLFMPNDTTGITSYYINVANAGLIQKFAYEYADLNRTNLRNAKDVESLLKLLPSNNILLNSFAHFAASNGIPTRWYYLNLSSELIVTQLKALIARNILGIPAYYQVMNTIDKTVNTALEEIKSGHADFPVKTTQQAKK